MATEHYKDGLGNEVRKNRMRTAVDATADLMQADKTGTLLWPTIPKNEASSNTPYIPGEVQEYKTRLDLLHNIGKRVASTSQLTQIVGRITKMTQRSLNASASSILLLDEQERELLFEVAEGQAGKQLRQVRINAKSGIAGWVAQHGKPLIVNDVSKDPRFNTMVDNTTGFVTKSIICAPLIVNRKIIGVIEVLNKLDGRNFSGHDMETLVSVASTAAMSIENTRLHQAIKDAYKDTIKALAAAIDAKDSYTSGHSQRVTEYVLLMANFLLFSKEEREVLEYASILHDIGKISIPDSILTKTGALTDDEQTIFSMHTLAGANMLKDVPFLRKASKLILHHHERYDGEGYPGRLKGEAIPLGARLITVADAFDAMTTARSYRSCLSVDYAVSELYRFSGKQFCPVAIDAFISGFRKFHFPGQS